MTKEQCGGIKKGDKLIFYRNGGVLSASIGNVFTFSRWYPKYDNDINRKYFYWQCKEYLDMGNHEHNFPIACVELFDTRIHVIHLIMNSKILDAQKKEFILSFGE